MGRRGELSGRSSSRVAGAGSFGNGCGCAALSLGGYAHGIAPLPLCIATLTRPKWRPDKSLDWQPAGLVLLLIIETQLFKKLDQESGIPGGSILSAEKIGKPSKQKRGDSYSCILRILSLVEF